MRVSVLTLFPEMFAGPLQCSILQRAQSCGLLTIELVPLRQFAINRHGQVDDAPYGGGPGMVLRADVLEHGVRSVARQEDGVGRVICLTPQGKRFEQSDARRLAALNHLVLVCGHYEGMDERFVQARVDEEISLGDFVLTGGEIPAMAIIDAVARLLPGVLGNVESAVTESFTAGWLDHPHYTRPAVWQAPREEGVEQREVPPVLLSGHHGAVAAWRRRQALLRTLLRRPDLLSDLTAHSPEGAALSPGERRLMQALAQALAAELD